MLEKILEKNQNPKELAENLLMFSFDIEKKFELSNLLVFIF